MHFNLLVVAAILAIVSATPSTFDQVHPFIPPTSTDVRSPCPGLNTLANHGFLPHDGQNISVPMIMDAALEAFNLNWDTILVAAKFGLLSGEDFGSLQTMRLDALGLHNLIEHDASLSRPDFGLGDHIIFNETIFSVLANSNPGKDFYDPTSAGGVQHDRLAQSIATNPKVVNTRKEFGLRSRESGFYLSIFGDPLTGIAPKEYVNIFFREERLPVAEGWKKPTTLITSQTLTPIERIVHTTSQWTITQQCEPLVLGPSITL